MNDLRSATKLGKLRLTRRFLRDCINEQVIPKSFPGHLRSGPHPFPGSARTALLEAIQDLNHKIHEFTEDHHQLLSDVESVRLTGELRRHRSHLRSKLRSLCNQSLWHHVGREDLIDNRSGLFLKRDQMSALKMGLKFAVNQHRNSTTDWLAKNYKREVCDLDQGFIQGVVFSQISSARRDSARTLPRRFIKALKALSERRDIVITSADKGGGVVILSTQQYKAKMNDLLLNPVTYERVPTGTTSSASIGFNKAARKILSRSALGKRLIHLLEEDPKAPRMRGLPKVHKPNVPMRPITSGIGSAPHRLAKILAKPLSGALGNISGSHLRNSGDLKERLSSVSFKNKKLVSFDVTSLFTEVPVNEALDAVRTAIASTNVELPLPEGDFIQLVELCVRFNLFEYDGDEFRQIHGMAMGSPLSAVMASLFMEVLESGPIREVIGRHVTWLRYVDDTLVILPRRTDTTRLLERLNSIHDRIKFTMEEEGNDNTIPFLDTRIHRRDDSVAFSVFRKSTNRDDFVHYFSGHDVGTKSGTVIGFFLRALRICDVEFLQEEINNVFDSFIRLYYPRGFITRCLEKARKIMRSTRENDRRKLIIVPSSSATKTIGQDLKAAFRVIPTCGEKIKNLVAERKRRAPDDNAVVYEIPCGGCDSTYIGETHRGLSTRLKEHQRDLRMGNDSNALVVHREQSGHLPKIGEARILKRCPDRTSRRLVESVLIASGDRINIRESSHKIPPLLSQIIATNESMFGPIRRGAPFPPQIRALPTP